MESLNTTSNSIEMQEMLSNKSVEKKSNVLSDNSGLSCRICFAGKSKGHLISLCNCKGSVGLVHRHCMQKWLQVKASDKCELCDTKLVIKKVSKDFKDWIEHKDNTNRRYFVIDSICVVVLFPITSFSLYLCISGAIRYSQSNYDTLALIALVVLLISSFFLWICVCIEGHRSAYQHFRQNNYKIIIVDNNKSETILKHNVPKDTQTMETMEKLSIGYHRV
jgi:hypothetical protein